MTRRDLIKTLGFLGIRDEWTPEIRAASARETTFDGGRIEWLRATSWPGVTATAIA